MRCKSTFPPDITATTFSLLYNYQLFLQVQVANAPAPSTTAFPRCNKSFIATSSSFSDTVTISSTNSFTISNVNSPGILTAQ